jgi:two-component system, chemotaxis family, sensor kinase CheA
MSQDPYKYFRIEARELSDQLSRTILDLERRPGVEGVAKLLRAAHTLKGAARVVRQREIADAVHALEELMSPYRGRTEALPPAVIDGALRLLDEVARRIAALGALEGGAAPPTVKPDAGDAAFPPAAEMAEIDVILAGSAETQAQAAILRHELETLERGMHLAELLTLKLGSSSARTFDARAARRQHQAADELKRVLAGVGRGFATAVERIERESAQVRAAAEWLRLAPVGALFVGLERAARDAAQELGKRVTFAASGADIRLEPGVLAALQDALVQIVRNGVAHGIEAPDRRAAAGKPPEGRITLVVRHRGTRVTIACADDGRGVDLEAVRRAAEKKGLLAGGAGAAELLSILLGGGISTSETVTEIAGRGVGMDVVREALAKLHGEIAVRTQEGAGTTIELTAPLSLAAVSGLGLSGGGISATIPAAAVRKALRLAPGAVQESTAGAFIEHDGRRVPFTPLEYALGGVDQGAQVARAWSAVLIECDAGEAAVGADRLLGLGGIVMRPLSPLTRAGRIVAGASLDAEGNPRLLLDPDALVRCARRPRARFEVRPPPRAVVLVVDDSLTTRMLEKAVLEAAGYEVEVAASAEEGLEMAFTRRHALILVDVELPGMDGFELVRRLGADARTRGIPAILVTSRSSTEDLRRGEEAGARHYIVKSEFDQAGFLQRIRELIASS